jgi:outer membrane translocation and assembly module TamA
VGVVRVDFGYPIQSEVVPEKSIRFHVSIGPDL